MAKFFTTCTYPNVLGLLSLTVCVMLATSAPTVHVRQVSGCDRRDIYYNVTTLLRDIDITNDPINTTLQLCKIVDSYYRVKAVDTTSDIYHTLETLEKLANDTFTFWKTVYCEHNCTDVDLEEFRRRCQTALVYNLLQTVDPLAFRC